MRKVAIAVKPLTGLHQLGNQIFEAVRVGTQTDTSFSQYYLNDFKYQVSKLRSEVKAVIL